MLEPNNVKDVSQAIEVIKKNMDTIFHWENNKPSINSQVGFGEYIGQRFGNLTKQDYNKVIKQANEIIRNTEQQQTVQGQRLLHAATQTKKLLQEYFEKNPNDFVQGTTSVFSKNVNNSTIANSQNIANKLDFVFSTFAEALNLSDAQKVAEEAAKKQERKTLHGAFADGLKELNISGKHVAMVTGGLMALGLINKALHKSDKETDTSSSLSNGMQPMGNSTAPASNNTSNGNGWTRNVYHDRQTGLNFRVKGMANRQLDSNQIGSLANGTVGGNSHVHTYHDSSRVNDNWLANKFAELT